MTYAELKQYEQIVYGSCGISSKKLPSYLHSFEREGNPKQSGYYAIYYFKHWNYKNPKPDDEIKSTFYYYHAKFDRWYIMSPADALPTVYNQSQGTALEQMLSIHIGLWVGL